MYDWLMLPCVRPTLSAALASIAVGSGRVNGTVPVRRHHVSRTNHWRMILLIIEHLKLGGGGKVRGNQYGLWRDRSSMGEKRIGEAALQGQTRFEASQPTNGP
jgi:hypothetical protein